MAMLLSHRYAVERRSPRNLESDVIAASRAVGATDSRVRGSVITFVVVARY